MKVTSLLLLILFKCINSQAQSIVPFEMFKSEVRALWAKDDYPKSIQVLLEKEGNYQANNEQHLITYYLGLLYLEINDFEKCFETFNAGFDQKFFFSFWPDHLIKLKQHANGQQIIERNTSNKEAYQKDASTKYEVMLPENYNPKNVYPLLYFLHGNNSNLESLKKEFENIELEEVIIVLAQSPFARSNYSFDWVDDISSMNGMQKIHSKILQEYSIDNSKIIASGFSNGARMAIDIFINESIPAIGFIAFNPSKKADNSNLYTSGKGAIITGENDYLLARQIALANDLLASNFPLRLVVLPDTDHDYPESFGEELNKSISFILK